MGETKDQTAEADSGGLELNIMDLSLKVRK